jgi:hypothetical protein
MIRSPIFSIKSDIVIDADFTCDICNREGHTTTCEPIDWSADDDWCGTEDLTPTDWGEEYQGAWHKRLWAK